MWFWSANFGNRELRVVQKTLEICLSKTHASGNWEVWIKDLSSQAMLIPDEKATMEKEWKEVIKKAHKKQKVRKVHFVALMDIRHIQNYKYIPGNVRKSNLKRGNYENFNLGQSLTEWLTVAINEKLREWIQNHPPVQIPSLSILEYFIRILTSRELRITVRCCANGREFR